jgi:small subunit ribosomal protein S8
MVNDPIADMLIQIKNATRAGKRVVELSYSNMRLALAKTLVDEGYIDTVEKIGEAPKFQLRIGIKYQDNAPAISDVKRVSKPGLRVYVDRHSIPTVVGGMGIALISTSQGIMTGSQAKKRGLGGEFLCEVW